MKFVDLRRPGPGLALLSSIVLGIGLAGCAAGTRPESPRAAAQLQPKSASQVAGSISFTQEGGTLRVVARVTGLTPNQEHGFHVHEKGDCSSADAMSAGGHFNPTAQPHGPQAAAHHGGDMPSLKADAMGNVDTRFTIQGVTLAPDAATSLIGKAVVVHAQPDDYATQPTGNSGGRVACGVIEAAKPM